jgi:hypothetical protein
MPELSSIYRLELSRMSWGIAAVPGWLWRINDLQPCSKGVAGPSAGRPRVPGLCSAEKLFPARMRDNFLAVTGINFLKLAD